MLILKYILFLLLGGVAMSKSDKFVKPTDDDLKQVLTPLQHKVTQCGGTEPPFQNEYWNNHRAGIYVDVVSGEALFSSLDKYDSGSGWPSFTKPLDESNVKFKADFALAVERTEVRSSKGDSHLGHVFDDGPGPTHKRYAYEKIKTGLRHFRNNRNSSPNVQAMHQEG